jgi:hypothetical protein
MHKSIAQLICLFLLLLIGCSTQRSGFYREPQEVSELRPRLALLREGMSYDEVSRILAVSLFPAGGSLNHWNYMYPSPLDANHLYSLNISFDIYGTNKALRRATLNFYESWPK